MLSELSEHTKKVVDLAGLVSPLSLGAVTAITASDVLLYLSILTCLLSSIWYGVRLYDRFAHGKRGE